jgi:hypothetical protein
MKYFYLILAAFTLACALLFYTARAGGDETVTIRPLSVDRAAGTITIRIADAQIIIQINRDNLAEIDRLRKLCRGTSI